MVTMKDIYGEIEGDANAEIGSLLPVTPEEGAPEGAVYGFRVEEAEVAYSGDSSKNPGRPYVRIHCIVTDPDDFEGERFSTMLYLPVPGDRPQRQKGLVSRFKGRCDLLAGPGAFDDVFGDIPPASNSLVETAMEELAERVVGSMFSAELTIRDDNRGRKQNDVVRMF